MASYGVDLAFDEHVSQRHPNLTSSIYKETSWSPHEVLLLLFVLVYPSLDDSKAVPSFEWCQPIHKLKADFDSAWVLHWRLWAYRSCEYFSRAMMS